MQYFFEKNVNDKQKNRKSIFLSKRLIFFLGRISFGSYLDNTTTTS